MRDVLPDKHRNQESVNKSVSVQQVCVPLTVMHEALLLSRFPKLTVRREVILVLVMLSMVFFYKPVSKIKI